MTGELGSVASHRRGWGVLGCLSGGGGGGGLGLEREKWMEEGPPPVTPPKCYPTGLTNDSSGGKSKGRKFFGPFLVHKPVDLIAPPSPPFPKQAWGGGGGTGISNHQRTRSLIDKQLRWTLYGGGLSRAASLPLLPAQWTAHSCDRKVPMAL